MSTVSADRSVTAPAPAFGGLSTRQECTALAQAMTIRARVKLAQAYASLYQDWIAEDQAGRETAKGTLAGGRSAYALPSLPGQPATEKPAAASSPARHPGRRARPKSRSPLLRWIRKG